MGAGSQDHLLNPFAASLDPSQAVRKSKTKHKSGSKSSKHAEEVTPLAQAIPSPLAHEQSDDVLRRHGSSEDVASHGSSEDSDIEVKEGRYAAIKCSILQLFGDGVDGQRTLPLAPPVGATLADQEDAKSVDSRRPASEKERPFTTGGKSQRHNLWRTPGHHDDGTWAGDAKSHSSAQKEAHGKKCLGGEFVVGTARAPLSDPFDPHASMMTSSIMSQSSSRSVRSQPAHDPYNGSWLGAAPSGRWVLKDGRPCCVPLRALEVRMDPSKIQATRNSLTAPKNPHGKTRRLTPHNQIGLPVDPPGGAHMGKRKTFFSMADFGLENLSAQNSSSGSGSRSSRSGSGSYSSSSSSSSTSSSASTSRRNTGLARSCRTARQSSGHQRESRKASGHHHHHHHHRHHGRKALLDKRSTRRRSQHHKYTDEDEIEEIQDILKPLDHMPGSGEETSNVLPRFSWTPGLASVFGSPQGSMAPEDFVHQELPFLSSRSSHKIDIMVSHNLRFRRKHGHHSSASSRAGSRHQSRRNTRHSHKHTSPFSSRRGTESTAHSVASSRRGTHKGIGALIYNKFPGHPPSRRSSHVVGHTHSDGRAGKMVDRDLRSELKKLQQSLLSSAQQAFGSDVWEECGIEAEHLKRQQLAQLIHGGLSLNRADKKDELDADEEEVGS